MPDSRPFYARNPKTGEWMRITFRSSTRVCGTLLSNNQHEEWPRINFAEYANEPGGKTWTETR